MNATRKRRVTSGGWRFKAALLERGWTQGRAALELSQAGQLRFTPQYVSKLVNNRAVPGRERAVVIETLLGIDVKTW